MKHLSDYNFFDPELLVCPYEFYKLAWEQVPIMELPSPKTNAKLFLFTRYDLVDSLPRIMAWIEDYRQKNERMPVFNPFETKAV